MTTKCRVVYPPEVFDFKQPPEPPVVFLAGSIDMGKAEDWQSQIIESLEDVLCVVLNPRRKDWDSSWKQEIENPKFREQVEWELKGLEQCSLIALCLTKDSKAPISLLEMGLHISDGRMIVHCPEGYWRKGNVDIVCARYGVPVLQDFEDFKREVHRRMLLPVMAILKPERFVMTASDRHAWRIMAREFIIGMRGMRMASIRQGDICTVDMNAAGKIGGAFFAPQQLKILRDIVRQGGGKVLVEDIKVYGGKRDMRNVEVAFVTAYDNPMSRIVGGVEVPASVLRTVGHTAATTIKEGDICTVNMGEVRRRSPDMDPSGNWARVVGQTVRQGGGRVKVTEVVWTPSNDYAMCVADHPMGGVMGAAEIPLSALRVVGHTAADSNHRDFPNKKEALKFLEDHAMMSVGWKEGSKEKVAIYWNGKLVVEDADTKKRWASGGYDDIPGLCREHRTNYYFDDGEGLIGVPNHRGGISWYQWTQGGYSLSGETATSQGAQRRRVSAFVDQPVPFDKETEDKLEREQSEAEEKLRKQLTEVGGRYYWEPGRTTLINITLTGRPLMMNYQIGGLFGMVYRDGILTINPQWVSARDSFPSYSWAQIADKMIQHVKQSQRVSEMVDKNLDHAESKLGFKIDPTVRRSILTWCEKAAARRIGVHAYPGPKGKEFVIATPEAAVKASFGSPLRSRRDYGCIDETQGLKLPSEGIMTASEGSLRVRVISSRIVESAKQFIGAERWDGEIQGEHMRLQWSDGRERHYRLTEMPVPGKKRLRVRSGGFPAWLGGSQKPEYNFMLMANVVRGIKPSMTYDQVAAHIDRGIKELIEESNQKAQEPRPEKELMSGPWETLVFYLEVEPANMKPFIAEGKDFKLEVSWDKFKAYSPDSDFQQADPYYSVIVNTSRQGSRKLYKMLKADPNALRSVSWGALADWLRRNGVGYDTQHSQWH